TARCAAFSRSRSTSPTSTKWSPPWRGPAAPPSPERRPERGMSLSSASDRSRRVIRRGLCRRAALLGAALTALLSTSCTTRDDSYWIGAVGQYAGDEAAHE